MVEATQVLQFFANGVAFGAILALAAIGLSLVYGILNLSNFAHGDFVAMGAFATLLLGKIMLGDLPTIALAVGAALVVAGAGDAMVTRRLHRSEQISLVAFGGLVALAGGWMMMTHNVGDGSTDLVLFVAALVAIVAVCALLVAFEYAIWRPLRRKRATTLTLIIVSIGLSLVVRNALLERFGGGNQAFARPAIPSDRFFGIILSDAQQFTIIATFVIIAGIHVFLRYTRAGKAMRALADNPDLARVSGIDVERLILYVWIITGALVTIAGLLLTLVQNNQMNANMGFSIIIALFASVILGGIGSAYGAMLGGFAVGIAMKTSSLWIGTEYELASAFLVLIVVLIIRPQGILGVKV